MFTKKFYIPTLLSLSIGLSWTGLSAQDINDISLESLLDVEISTAAKYEQNIGEVPASVQVITAEDIKKYGFVTIAQVLNTIPGFYMSYDRNYNYAGVRGFSRPSDYNNRILLLLDGHKINDNFYGSVDPGTFMGGINLSSIEKIEIIHGPGSVLYGTGAMFAVINLISKKGNEINGFELGVETGSFGRKKVWLTSGKEFDNGLEAAVSGIWMDTDGQDLYYDEFDDPSTNNGIAEGLDWDKYYGFRFNLAYGDFHLHGLTSKRSKGIPTAPWESRFNVKGERTDETINYVELSYDHDLNAAQNIFIKIYSDYYTYDGDYPYEYEDEDDGLVRYLWQDKNEGFWFGTELRFLWDTHSNNRIISGMEYQYSPRAYYKEWDPWEATFDRNFTYSVFSAFVQDEYQMLKNLSLTAGLRYDNYLNMGSYATPRLAAIYNPLESSTLKVLYGVAFRAPSLYEKYYEDPVYGYKANPDINREKINTTELVWEQKMNQNLFGTVSVFYYKLTDLIDQVTDPVDSLIQHQNAASASAHGAEMELKARYDSGLNAYISYSFQQTKDDASGEKLSNSPSHLFKAGLYYPMFDLFTMAADFRYESERITVYETKTDPYFIANLTLTTRPVLKHLVFSAKVQNLFDTEYQTPGGWEHLQPAITQDGRNYIFRLQYQL